MKIIKNKSIWIITGLILLISLLHYFGGPINAPIHRYYRLLYFVPIIFAAFQFGFKGGVISSICISLIYSPFILLSIGKFREQALNELLDIIIFFAIGIITGTLVEKKNIHLTKMEEQLKRHILLESYINRIIESIKSGVIAVNSDLLITIMNEGAKDLLNINPSGIGLNITEVISNPIVCNKILSAIKENIIYENIEATLEKENSIAVVRINIYPLNIDNQLKGYVIIMDDITELKRLYTQLVRNEKLSALGELSTGIAHEIRNPLGIIKAIEQTMKKELSSDPEAIKELDIIDEEIERANKVVKGLMDFGRPSKHEMMVYTLNSVLDEVLTITNKYINQHNVWVENIREDHSEIIMDKDQIKQAFINIIFNAVQSMPDGGTLTITTSRYNERFVKVIFADTGIGIEQENLERIFNPFFTTKEDGTGLGLSIVQRIIEDHGGMVNVSSKKEEGSKFELLLPVKKEKTNEKDIDCR